MHAHAGERGATGRPWLDDQSRWLRRTVHISDKYSISGVPMTPACFILSRNFSEFT